MATKVIQKRYVAVVGKAGAGKSTVANKILGISPPKGFLTSHSLDAVTEEITHIEATICHSTDHYDVTVFDTVGLMESKKKTKDTMQQIKSHFRENCPNGLSLVLFVFKSGRFTDDERMVFDLIMNYCYDAVSSMSALVITCCEQLGEAKRAEIVKDFKSNPKTKKIAKFMKKGIFTVGFPEIADLKPVVQRTYEESMEEDRLVLRDLVASASENKMGKQIFSDNWWLKCPLL